MNFQNRILGAGLVALVALSVPAWAQSAASVSPGPVHVPSGYATNAADATIPTTIAPVSSLVGPAPAPGATNAPAAGGPLAATPSATGTATTDAGDIHDIRGVIAIPYPLLWVLYVLGGVALAAVLYFAWNWLRRTVIKPKLPHELALERLAAARALMNENQVREYAFAVSEVIRNYIEQRFGERARRRTTEEFLADLLKQRGTPLAEHRALLEDFLNHCDLPKFARWQLSTTEMESMYQSAHSFISNTRPGAPAHTAAPVAAQPETVSAQ